MTRAKPSREALEAWLRKGSAYAAGRILMAIRAMDTADVSGNEQAELIEFALDRAVADERERLRVAVKSMRYDNLWGGQRRVGWELGKDQALEIIGEPS